MATNVRFDCFDLDLAPGQLFKRGVRVRLGEKSFQVLASLVEHAGEVVTREDLQRRLWPDDVFVDFANNLNTAIGRLREALGDCALGDCALDLTRRSCSLTGAMCRRSAELR